MNKNGWNESDLASVSGLSRQAVNFLISGRTKSPSPDTIEKICNAFGVPVEEGYRAANLLRPVNERSQYEDELLFNANQMDEDGRRHLIIISRALADANTKGKKNHRGAAEATS